jgi:hypothetical protein
MNASGARLVFGNASANIKGHATATAKRTKNEVR